MTNECDNHAAFHKFYNCLLEVGEAAAALKREDRHTIFEELTRLLAKYPNSAGSGAQFGICLVHRHFELDDGEKMVSDGNITQPQFQPESVYPSRWTAEGKPFEFTRDKTKPLPDDLPPNFQAIVNKYDVNVLGLYYVEDPTLIGVGIERLDSSTRSHIVDYVESLPSDDHVETDWAVRLLGRNLAVPYDFCQCILPSFLPSMTLPVMTHGFMLYAAAPSPRAVLSVKAGCFNQTRTGHQIINTNSRMVQA